jgi:hypothetical protein
MTRCEQPLREVVRRWRINGQQWALLVCTHEEPNNDRPVARFLRCTSCVPVPKEQPR